MLSTLLLIFLALVFLEYKSEKKYQEERIEIEKRVLFQISKKETQSKPS